MNEMYNNMVVCPACGQETPAQFVRAGHCGCLRVVPYNPEQHHCPEPLGNGSPCVIIRPFAGPNRRHVVAPAE